MAPRSWWHVHSIAWLAPATAAALGVIVWAILPRVGSVAPARQAVEKDLRPVDQRAVVVTPPPSALEPNRRRLTFEEPSRDASGRSTGRDNLARGAAPSNEVAFDAQSSTLRAKTRGDAAAKVEQPQRKELADAATGPATSRPPETAAGAPAPSTGNRAALASPAPAPVAPPPPPAAAPSQRAIPPAALAESVAITKEPAAGAPGGARPTAQRGAQEARLLAFETRPGAEVTIVSSNANVRWRIRPDGTVQRTTDAGSSWQDQPTGAGGRFAAGSSPSPTVCWLAGSQGLVALTNDGRTWQRIAFPETVDLVSIRATDEKTAIATSVDGRTFATNDRGATWTRTSR